MDTAATHPTISRREFAALVPDELLKCGVVNVIGLDSIKERTGERWEKVRDSIYSRLEAILRRKLRGEDFFTRLSPVAYLVTMPGADREYAQVCCLSITVELHRSLFGSCDLGKVEILAGMPGNGDTIALEALPADEIRTLASKHRLNEFDGGAGEPRLNAGLPALPQSGPEAKGFVFWPIWDARKEAVIGHRCVAASGNVGSSKATGAQNKAKADLHLALSGLKHGAETLLRHLDRGERFFVSIPISYESLSCPLTRAEIAAACRDLSNRLRAYLLFEITDVPRGVPAGRLADLAATIRPFCKGVVVHAPFRDRTFASHAVNVVQAIALDIPNAATNSEVRSEIDRVRQDAQKLGCLSILTNVADPELFRFAASRGVNLISGPLLGAVLEPRPMHRLRANEILERAAASQAPRRVGLHSGGFDFGMRAAS